MKFLSLNKKGICSVQVIIILCSCLIISTQLILSSKLTLATISRREAAIQERLYGESIFQVVDLYLVQSMNKTYNNPQKYTITSNQTNDEIKNKILRYALGEMANTEITNIGKSMKQCQMLKNMGIECKEISRTVYTYDNGAGIKQFKINSNLNLEKVSTSDDFALKIHIKVKVDNQIYVYGKDYFFIMPKYSDELIKEIKTFYGGGTSETWKGTHKFNHKEDMISSEVYYENL
ncbi:hypothetical protein [Proteocatella sphenisci]|uniref:hypothetical protein n=1 Tax=Proteocatella sphenisci TaxID=181070 RepID=UPI00048C6BD0|nr:hypothetical protein [Proteocatella sphenisci]